MEQTTGGSQPRLQVVGLGKTYGAGEAAKEVIRDLSFEVQDREFVCIVGPSGIGKSTLLGCISGLQPPTAGYTAIDGTIVSGPPRKMAVVFQEYTRSLMPWLTIEKNVALPLRNSGLTRREARGRCEQALAEVGLPDVGAQYPWQLSGGMQQRVAIARAIAYQPEVLLMDEPFASVDAQTRMDLEELSLKIREDLGITIVLVTHDIDEAVYLSDRIVVLGGKPSRVEATVDVPLGRTRNQITTRGSTEFGRLRTEVLGLIRNVRQEASDARSEAGQTS